MKNSSHVFTELTAMLDKFSKIFKPFITLQMMTHNLNICHHQWTYNYFQYTMTWINQKIKQQTKPTSEDEQTHTVLF